MNLFFIKTLCCKVNQCDSQELRLHFLKAGLKETAKVEEADLCVVNTCCVTHHADRKSRNLIRDIVRRKKSKDSRIAVTGCYVHYDRVAIEEIEGVNAVFELNKKRELLDWVNQYFSLDRILENAILFPFGKRTRAFLKVQDGCDNRCSYCIVPFVRGPSHSKEIPKILNEANQLIDAGHKEIVLTGVNLGSFGRDLQEKRDLVDLIGHLENLKGLLRIRLSSLEAQDVTNRLIDKMASSEKLCPHLHIPFQSGDDAILKAMNKQLTTQGYLRIIQEARHKIKDLAISCDMIVGFPFETEKNFKNTLRFLKAAKPMRTHIFTFSERKGVAIFGKKKTITGDTIQKRYNILKQIADKMGHGFKKRYLKRNLNVLFEAKKDGLWLGYSPNYIKVGFKSAEFLNNALKTVKLSSIKGDFVLASEAAIIS